MASLFLTITIAFILIVLALAGLAIGWLITGKSKIQAGACGRVPNQKKEDCGTNTTCSLCENEKKQK